MGWALDDKVSVNLSCLVHVTLGLSRDLDVFGLQKLRQLGATLCMA